VIGLACGLLVATGCSQKAPPREGGASGSKAEKARKDAEALALNAVTGGAAAQAKAVPESAVHRDWTAFGGRVAISRETWMPAVHMHKTAAAAKAPATPALPTAPPLPMMPTTPVTPVAAAPAPRSAPRPGPAVIIRERVVSVIATTEAEAEEDALAQARDLIERRLAELDPPVRYKPSIGEVKSEFVRNDSRTVRPPDAREKTALAEAQITGNPVHVEFDVEVTVDQVRELRSQERASAALRVLGLLVAVALAGFLFLRADEWTKGYLTSWLALGAVVLAGGAAAVLIFV
jgi:hypothetical protein